MTHLRAAAHARSHVGRVSDRSTGVDGRRTANHLRRRGAVGTLVGQRTGAAERLTARSWRAGRVVGCITGRAVAPGMVHWKRCGRGGRGEGSEAGVLRYLAGRRGTAGGDAVEGLDAGGGFALSEPEVFQARIDRAHKEEAARGRRGEKEKKRGTRCGRGGRVKKRYELDGGVWKRKSRELVSSQVASSNRWRAGLGQFACARGRSRPIEEGRVREKVPVQLSAAMSLGDLSAGTSLKTKHTSRRRAGLGWAGRKRWW